MTSYTRPQPEDVYGPGSKFHTFHGESVFGIGAHDSDVIDMTNVTQWTPEAEAPFYTAGELYTEAIRGANEMRRTASGRRAFEQRMGL